MIEIKDMLKWIGGFLVFSVFFIPAAFLVMGAIALVIGFVTKLGS
jgi:hypothetical protein